MEAIFFFKKGMFTKNLVSIYLIWLENQLKLNFFNLLSIGKTQGASLV